MKMLLPQILSYIAEKHRVESEATIKGSLDVINEEKDESADDMMGLGFSLVGSFEQFRR